MARDRSSHRLNIIVREVAATVACDLGSDSSLPKLREFKRIRGANLADRQHRIRNAAFNSETERRGRETAVKKSIGNPDHHV